MSIRIGIDVGGTNTDAVAVSDAGTLLTSAKVPTTSDPFDGIRAALAAVVSQVDRKLVTQVMLGTTHPANAIIERRGLDSVGVLRLGAPATLGVRPGAAWPKDLRDIVIGTSRIIGGGNEYDGTEISALDEDAVRRFAAECKGKVASIAVAGVFSPANFEHELRAGDILQEELGRDFPMSLSHRVGALGLLERENATILNSSLLGVARRMVDGFRNALAENTLVVESYLTQNDGTLMTADEAVRLPVFTLGSGPTNSMRGACSLAGLSDAVVIDVGGTSADVGVLIDGFPRESASAVEVGGVRTNFRMPDLIAIGLGGGSVVREQPGRGVQIGPESVGYGVRKEALLRGGSTLTLSDISVFADRLLGFDLPGFRNSANVDSGLVSEAIGWVDTKIQETIDRMRASRNEVPLIAVGGGSHLVPMRLNGITEVIRPDHYEVANAFGAAIAEASGSIDRVYRYEVNGRDSCLDDARRVAIDSAIRAGADPESIRITSVAEIPLSYVPGGACRVHVKAAGPLQTADEKGMRGTVL
jgi:N-methylhydantoinase A/oxoprolinase/acetone carboxylase beta subunit